MIDVKKEIENYITQLKKRGKSSQTIYMAKSNVRTILSNFSYLDSTEQLSPEEINKYLLNTYTNYTTYNQYKTNINKYFEYVLLKPNSFVDLPSLSIDYKTASKTRKKRKSFSEYVTVIGYDLNNGEIIHKRVSSETIYAFGFYNKFKYVKNTPFIVKAFLYCYVKTFDTSHIINIDFSYFKEIKNMCKKNASVVLVNFNPQRKKNIDGYSLVYESKDYIVKNKYKNKFTREIIR